MAKQKKYKVNEYYDAESKTPEMKYASKAVRFAETPSYTTFLSDKQMENLAQSLEMTVNGFKKMANLSDQAAKEIDGLQRGISLWSKELNQLEQSRARMVKEMTKNGASDAEIAAATKQIDRFIGIAKENLSSQKNDLKAQQENKAAYDKILADIARSRAKEDMLRKIGDKTGIPVVNLPPKFTGLVDKLANNKIEREQNLKRIKELEEKEKTVEGLSEKEKEELQDRKDNAQKQQKQLDALKKLEKLGDKMLSKLSESVDAAMKTMSQYLGPMSARLQGSGQDFHSIRETLESTLTGSPYVSQKALLENVSKLVQAGITYNLEQRALLATLADRMVSSFNALDASLTRLTRLQRADLTTTSMGVEAQLLRFLNANFKDNSYLTDAYDTVSDALLEAMSQLPYTSTPGFAFNLQKWLGALYSMGLSKEAVSTIAQGVGYLGSGDVTALTGNTQLQTLMAMSASKAGLSYSEMLTKGIDETEINKLMKAMVEYLQDIASNTEENKVVRAAYGNVFGNLSVSDIRAISSLSQASIDNIFNSSMNYDSAVSSANYQLAQIRSRTTIQEKIDNVVENTLTTFGNEIAENAGLYLTWKIGGVLVDLGAAIPKIGNWVVAAGAIAKAAVGLKGLVSTVTKLFNSWDNGFGVEGGFTWSRTMEGVSSSYGLKLPTKSYSTSSVLSHDEIAAEVESGRKDVAGFKDTVGRDVEDIYKKLFEDKEAVRVSIDEKNRQNQEAIQKTLDEMMATINTLTGNSGSIKESTAAIKSKLDNKIQVDIVDNDVSAITGAIYSMRNVGSNNPFIRP